MSDDREKLETPEEGFQDSPEGDGFSLDGFDGVGDGNSFPNVDDEWKHKLDSLSHPSAGLSPGEASSIVERLVSDKPLEELTKVKIPQAADKSVLMLLSLLFQSFPMINGIQERMHLISLHLFSRKELETMTNRELMDLFRIGQSQQKFFITVLEKFVNGNYENVLRAESESYEEIKSLLRSVPKEKIQDLIQRIQEESEEND